VSSAVDWDFAQKIGSRIADRHPFDGSYHYEVLRRDFELMTAQAEELVAEETGLVSLEGKARARVADRSMWIRANIASFQRLLGPITEKLGVTEPEGIMGEATKKVGATQVGVVLGWMATKVLGQYDLLLTEDEDRDQQDIVYYVGPNIKALEDRHGFDPQQFRLWIALHECTHRAQFTGVPWLREHFLSLVNQTLDAVDPDPGRLMEVAREVIEARKRGEDPLAAGGLPALFANEEQRAVLDQVMGMMSLLEGHGDITMDRAGKDLLPDAPQFARTLRERRGSASGVSKLTQRLMGIEAKMNQYALGEDFIEGVEAVGGREAMDLAWEKAENLPSMDEIRTPSLWLDRVANISPGSVAVGASAGS